MKTIFEIILAVALFAGFSPQNSYSQDRKLEADKDPRVLQATVQNSKVVENIELTSRTLDAFTNKTPETQFEAPLVTRTASASGNWSSTTTWGGSPAPTSSDAVVINAGITVTVNVANAQCATLTFNTNTNKNTTVTINGTNALTVTGLVTMPRPTSSNYACTININSGTFTCGSLRMNATVATRYDIINITTGTFTVSGDITSGGTSGCYINFTNTGTMNLGGNFINYYPTIPTFAGCTLNYTGSADQYIYPMTYAGNLGLSGTGTKNIAYINTVSVIGDFTNNSTLLLDTGKNIDTNTVLIIGGNCINKPGATITSIANFTRFSFNSANAQTFTNDGTITAPMASLDISNTNASGVTLAGTPFIVTRVNLFRGTIVNSTNLTIGNGGATYGVVQRGEKTNTSPAGIFDVAPNLNIGTGGMNLLYDNASSAYNTGLEVPGTGTVMAFHIFNAADVTMNSNLTVTNELKFNAGTGTPTFRIGANTLTLNGLVTYGTAGAFYGGATSNLVLNGGTTVNSIINNLNNLTINGNNNLGGVLTVNGTLNLTSGLFVIGSNLTMASGSTISRSGGSLYTAPTFAGTVNLVYSGASAMNTGMELPTGSGVINNLTANAGGVTQYLSSWSTPVNVLTDLFPNLTSWTGDIGSGDGKFVSNASANAGGTSPEARFTGSVTSPYPHSDKTYYIYSAAVNTTGYTGVNVSFKTKTTGNYTQNVPTYLKLQSSTSASGPWNDVWSAPYSVLAAQTITIPSYTTDVGGNMYFQFAFVGDFYCLDYWYIDNLVVDGKNIVLIPSTATINGTLDVTNGSYSIGTGNTLVLNGGITGSSSLIGSTTSSLTIGGSGAIFDLPAITNGLNNFTIDHPNGVTLSGGTAMGSGSNLNVNGNLTLTSGNLFLGSNNLTLGSSSIIVGTPSASNMVVPTSSGELRKTFTGTGSFTFPVGDNTGTAEYSPVTLNFTAGTFSSAYVGVNLVNAKHPNNYSTASYLNRYWNLSQSGITGFSCDVNFLYLLADVAGTVHNESDIWGGKWNTSAWLLLNPTDLVLHQISGTVTSFSSFTGGQQGALPVELSSFTSIVNGRNAKLNWATASEINNAGFDVERKSLSGVWTKIGFVQGNGNIASSYSYQDRNLQTGKYSYRLKQIDVNGNFEYHNLNGEVEIGVPGKFELSQNYPNPFNPTTKIDYNLPFDSKVNIVLYDMTGREVMTIVNKTLNAGYYTEVLNLSSLTSGTYFYRLTAKSTDKDYVSTKKMTLVK